MFPRPIEANSFISLRDSPKARQADPSVDRSAFRRSTDELYEPLGKTGHNVDCSYLDWWDAHLIRHRLGPHRILIPKLMAKERKER
jgi:hypothetical protein